MKSKIFRITYLAFIIIIFLSLLIFYFRKKERKELYSSLTDFTCIEIDGQINSTKNLPNYNGYALILFNPGCEMCQEEVEDFSNNSELFQDYCLLFLSPDSLNRIADFVKKYQIFQTDNVFYGYVDLDTINKKLGKSPVPGLFIFDSGKKLKKFTLAAEVDDVLNYFSE